VVINWAEPLSRNCGCWSQQSIQAKNILEKRGTAVLRKRGVFWEMTRCWLAWCLRNVVKHLPVHTTYLTRL